MSNETNVYEGNTDERQTAPDDVVPEPSLFRKRYKALTKDEIELHDAIKEKADELAILFSKVQLSPYHPLQYDVLRSLAINQGANITLALRHLEDAVYRAVKALTA